jgi:hypothetical protein
VSVLRGRARCREGEKGKSRGREEEGEAKVGLGKEGEVEGCCTRGEDRLELCGGELSREK